MSRMRELYEQAQQQAPEARRAWLAVACDDAALRARIEALLDAADTVSNDPLAQRLDQRLDRLGDIEAPDDAAARWIGRRIGPFRLQSLIGQGGMAAVFLARREDADFDQPVAVKLLRRGVFSSFEQRLFRRERQALATLSHPNIARLIDGGVDDDGNAYLAMEYVDGLPLVGYCSTRGLGLAERLALLVTVCRAVDAAHRSLIVHRDLKPSNILVDADGAVKLLDFGIAKLLDHDEGETTRGFSALTPEYAAPEQFADGAITTATDVFALGVILRELLLGERPPRDTGERPSVLAERLTVTPIASSRVLRGDLDNIAGKALATEPERRYPSAGAMADDLAAFLDGRPVAAHPPSVWYRTRKFVQRHRGGVTITVLLLIALLASVVVTAWQAQVAREQARLAREQAARADAVRDFLLQLLDTAKAELPRDVRPTPDVLVKAARTRLDADHALPAATRGELYAVLAAISQANGDYEAALGQYTAALEEQSKTLPDNDPQRLRSAVQRAVVLTEMARPAEARAALAAVRPLLIAHPTPASIEGLATESVLLMNDGKTDDALALLRQASVLASGVYGKDTLDDLSVAFMSGNALAVAGRYTDAIAELAPRVARWRQLGLPEDSHLSEAIGNLAAAYDGAGDLVKAEATYREALALRRRIFGNAHPSIATALGNLGTFLSSRGRLDEARPLLVEALEMKRGFFGAHHPRVLAGRLQLAMVDVRRRDFDAAEAGARSALEPCDAAPPLADAICPKARQVLANVLFKGRGAALAAPVVAQAVRESEALFGKGDSRTAAVLSTSAAIHRKLGELDKAVADIDAALAAYSGKFGPNSDEVLLTRHTRVAILADLHRDEEAAREIDAIVAVWRSGHAQDRVNLQSLLRTQAESLLRRGKADEARALAKEALAIDLPEALQDPGVMATLRRIDSH